MPGDSLVKFQKADDDIKQTVSLYCDRQIFVVNHRDSDGASRT